MTEKYSVVSLKMRTSQLRRVEGYAKALNANIGSEVFSRSHSVRALIDLGLSTPVVTAIMNGYESSVRGVPPKKRKAKKRTAKRRKRAKQ